ncbi:MAG: hypothetical protein ACOX22_01390 [Caldicoprobacterales bacterium]|jgi:hypothetical protein
MWKGRANNYNSKDERGVTMEIFDELSRSVKQAAKQVEEKTGELIEIGKLNIEIFRLEDARRRLYRKIGEQICKEFAEGQAFSEIVNTLCLEVQEKNKLIDEYRVKKNDLKTRGNEYSSSNHTQADSVNSTEQAADYSGQEPGNIN